MDVATIAAIFSPLVTLLGLIVIIRGQNITRRELAQSTESVERAQWHTAVAVEETKEAQWNTAVAVEGVAAEVSTTNGITQGELAERAEGRRIEEIPAEERTTSEQEYVDKLHAGGRDLGHDGPTDRTIGPEGPPPKTQAERDAT
jgi:hypothetical protein